MTAQPKAASAEPLVLVARDDGITHLTMNRPQARNALSIGLMTALEAAIDDAASDAGTRVVVISGAGPAFCAGHDLKEIRANPGETIYRNLFTQCARLMTKIVRMPKPVIARVHATATAAGCQLVATCDLAVSADTAQFATPGVNIGLFCSTPMVALTRAVPRKAAFEMLTTGRLIEAEEARALGLVNRIAPAEGLAAATRDLAETVAAKLGAAVAIGKGAFYDQAELGLEAAYALAGEAMVTNMLDADTAEGVCAFIEKRRPAWAD